MRQLILASLVLTISATTAIAAPSEAPQSVTLDRALQVEGYTRICHSDERGTIPCDPGSVSAADRRNEVYCFITNDGETPVTIAAGTAITAERRQSYRASITFVPALEGRVDLVCDAKEHNPVSRYINGTRRWARVSEIVRTLGHL